MAYDAPGRVVRVTYPTGGGSEGYGYSTNVAAATSCTHHMGFVTRYAFDSFGRKTNEVFGAGTADAATNSYVYNGAGDLLSPRDGRGNAVSWTYDQYGRVKSKLATRISPAVAATPGSGSCRPKFSDRGGNGFFVIHARGGVQKLGVNVRLLPMGGGRAAAA